MYALGNEPEEEVFTEFNLICISKLESLLIV